MPPDAFEPAFRAWHGRILGWAYNVTTDYNLAQEVAADTFVKAWQAWAKLPDDADVQAWLWRISRNLLYDRARTRYRWQGITIHDIDDDWHVTCPLDYTGSVERWADFAAAWGRLTEHQQKALILMSQGYNSDDGGKAMGISALAYRLVVWRGRTTLERWM